MPETRRSAHSATTPPGEAAVRSQLERILASEAFARARRSSDVLRFIVEKTLGGDEDVLNGQSIAVEVFGRDTEFDAAGDPLVRVEARRVRQRLAEYYLGPGQADPVIIEVPRGGYVARFSGRQRKSTGRLLRRLALALTALALLAIAIVLRFDGPGPTSQENADAARRDEVTAPRLLVTPFRNVSGDSGLDYFAFGLTEEVTLRLQSFQVDVVAGLDGFRNGDNELSLADLRRDIRFDYMLTGTVQGAGGRLRVTARLVDGDSGTQIWTTAFDEQASVPNLLALQTGIAERVAAIVSGPYGPVVEREGALAANRAPQDLASYQCVLRTYYYSHFADPQGYADTVACLEIALEQDPGYADAWGGLANMLTYEFRLRYGPDPAGARERATEAALTALDIDGSNLLGVLALVRLSFLQGDLGGFEDQADRLLGIAPNDPLVLAVTGIFYVTSGRADRGLPLLDRAFELSYRPPGWFYLGYAVDAIRAGDYDTALRWAQRTDMPNWYHAPLFMAATAGLSGNVELASRYLARTQDMVPDIASTVRSDLGLWQLDEPTLERIVDGLRLAGLDVR